MTLAAGILPSQKTPQGQPCMLTCNSIKVLGVQARAAGGQGDTRDAQNAPEVKRERSAKHTLILSSESEP